MVSVKQKHVIKIESAVQVACNEAMMELPNYADEECKSGFEKEFLFHNYYDIVAKHIADFDDEDFIFEPVLSPSDITDEDARSKATTLIARVQKKHVQVINESLSEAWNDSLRKLSTCARKSMKKTDIPLFSRISIMRSCNKRCKKIHTTNSSSIQ